MRIASEGRSSRDEASISRIKAYVAYAESCPEIYRLMFRAECLDLTLSGSQEAINEFFAELCEATASPGRGRGPEVSLDHAAAMVASWSLAHGFAILLLDDRLTDVSGRVQEEANVEALLEAVVETQPK